MVFIPGITHIEKVIEMEIKFCHGNKKSLRADIQGFKTELFVYGKRNGIINYSSYLMLNQNEVKICDKCGFIFKGSFRIGTTRDKKLITTNNMKKILEIINFYNSEMEIKNEKFDMFNIGD